MGARGPGMPGPYVQRSFLAGVPTGCPRQPWRFAGFFIRCQQKPELNRLVAFVEPIRSTTLQFERVFEAGNGQTHSGLPVGQHDAFHSGSIAQPNQRVHSEFSFSEFPSGSVIRFSTPKGEGAILILDMCCFSHGGAGPERQRES